MKLVAATLADRADDNGGGIRLSQDAIGKRTSLSGRQVRHWLRELERITVLVVERRPTQHTPTHYRMPIEALHALARPEADFHPDDDPDRKPASTVKQSRPEVQRRQTGSPASPDRKPASDKTSLRRPKASQGGSVAAASDALTRAAAAPPAGVDADGWKKLLSARPELDSAALAEQAAFHLAEGCPAKALNRAVDGLRLTLHHKGLSPSYKRANGSAAAPRPRKRAGRHVFVAETFGDKDYTITEGAP